MKTLTILGPSHGGKSTLVTALAALSGAATRAAVMFGGLGVTEFSFMDEAWSALDVPGGPEALPLAARALAASDAAVLVVPAEVDAAVLAAPYLRLLEQTDVPTFVFINKLDAGTDRISDVAHALQTYSAHGIVLREVPIREGDKVTGVIDLISERAWHFEAGKRSTLMPLPDTMKAREEEARADLLEHLADFDDALMEELIEDHAPMTEEVYEVATRVLQHHDLIPALMGSATEASGISRLMKSLRHEVPDVTALAARSSAAAVIAGADHVKHLGKVVLLRALDTGVAAGGPLGGSNIGGLVALDAKTPVKTLEKGGLALAVKSDHLTVAAPCLETGGAATAPDWTQARRGAHAVLVSPQNERDETRLSAALAKLAEIDPALSLDQDPRSGKALLRTQGPLHLRRLETMLDEVFGVAVTTEPTTAPLRETIRKGKTTQFRHRKQSGGAGQFADVVLDIAPLPRGAGVSFSETVKGGAVPRNYIPAVEAGAREALVEGPKGHEVVDVAVTLTDGKHHDVDSSDFAFRIAGKTAVREALADLGTQVLQPIDRVEIAVPSVYSGGLAPLVTGLKGQVLGFDADPQAAGWDVFSALMPAAAEEALFQSLGAATRGTAWFTASLDHYEEMYS